MQLAMIVNISRILAYIHYHSALSDIWSDSAEINIPRKGFQRSSHEYIHSCCMLKICSVQTTYNFKPSIIATIRFDLYH